MIYSLELEQHVLAGLIKMPDAYAEIAAILKEEDFYSENTHVNQTIFKVLRMALENGDNIDEIILAQRIVDLNISFEDNLNITKFIQKLGMRRLVIFLHPWQLIWLKKQALDCMYSIFQLKKKLIYFQILLI